MTKRESTRAVIVAGGAAAGVLVALRAVATLHIPDLVPLLGVETVPVEDFGIRWSESASWPEHAQTVALARLVGVLAGAALACVAVASLNALAVLAEASAARRAELAVRAALGATPGALGVHLLAEMRTLALAGLALGLVGGMAGGLALRLTWPGVPLPLTSPPLDLLVALGALSIALVVAHLSGARGATRPGRLAGVLRTGPRASPDPAAIFARSSLAALQSALAATVLAGALALTVASVGVAPGGGRSHGERSADPLRLASIEPPSGAEEASGAVQAWGDVLRAVAGVPGIEAETLAAPGALLGLGVRDVAVTQCGACWRGQFPAPLWSARADHHVVSPGYFDLFDVPVVEGRPFRLADDGDAEPVAIVNRTFALTSFDAEGPLGRKIRIGPEIDAWYTVVGIVEDEPRAGLGSDGLRREAVYLSALQRPPRRASLVARGSEVGFASAVRTLGEGGWAIGEILTLEDHLAEATAPIRWSRAVAALLSVLVAALAVQGVRTLALQTTRRRAGEIALRRALGASSGAIVRHVMVRRLRIGLWGVAGFLFLGTLAMALLQRAVGVAGLGLPGYAAIAAVLVGAGQLASLRAVREALAVPPARLLE